MDAAEVFQAMWPPCTFSCCTFFVENRGRHVPLFMGFLRYNNDCILVYLIILRASGLEFSIYRVISSYHFHSIPSI